MVRNQTTEIAAEASIRTQRSQLFIGAKARDRLNVGYNDKVAVTFPNVGPGGSDVRKVAAINSGNRIPIGSLGRQIVPETHDGSYRLDVIIEDVDARWEDDYNLTDHRWDQYYQPLEVSEL